jgi:hypothetical protein
MYDPLIVDAFIDVHARIRQEFGPAVNAGLTIPSISRSGNTAEQSGRTARLNDIAAGTEEMMILYDLAIALSAKSDVTGMIEEVFTQVRRLVPATTCVFYKYDPSSDELVATQVSGEYSANFLGLRIRRGERLTGWVAANKRTIVNSDPVLDLGDMGRRLRPLQNCLSTPLVSGDDLVGVLTLYSTSEAGFGEDHRRIVESIVKQLAPRVKTALAIDGKTSGGAGQRTLQQAFGSTDFAPASDVSIIVITVRMVQRKDSAAETNTEPGFERVADSIKKGLRVVDLLLRHKTDQFLVLLPQTDLSDALGVATRVSVLLAEDLADELTRQLEVVIGVATAPTDGSSLEVLMRSAVKREQLIVPQPPNSLIH